MNESTTNENVNSTSNNSETTGSSNVFKSFLDRIMNSKVINTVTSFINSFISNFGLSSTKERVDDYVDNAHESERDTIFHNMYRRVSKFVTKKLGGRVKSTKLLTWISKFICTVVGIGFGALVIYMMIKLLPKIIMMVAMIFAVTISIEIIISILNRAVTPVKETA